MRIVTTTFLAFSVLALAACGTASDTPAPYNHYGADAAAGAGSAGAHTVGAGDTLWSIAKRYRLSMPDIIYLNDLAPPYALDVGERVSLPPPNEYKVRAGDTLYGISRAFDVSVTQLARQNRIQAPYRIEKGDVLRLPSVRPQSNQAVQVADSGDTRTAPLPGQRPQQTTAARPGEKPVYKPQRLTKQPPARQGKTFHWPVDGKVLSDYGPKDGGLHNDGINIKMPRGAKVAAAESGVVVYAGDELKGYGNLVLVKHADRWMTAYAHLDKISVTRGATISRGQALGTVGSTGGVDVPQLHFEIRRGTEALNPEFYMARRGS